MVCSWSPRPTRNGLSDVAPTAARCRTTSVICSLYGTAAWTRCCALTIRDAAMSSMARVIFLVACTVRMRFRRMRSWPPAMVGVPAPLGYSVASVLALSASPRASASTEVGSMAVASLALTWKPCLNSATASAMPSGSVFSLAMWSSRSR